MLIRPTSVFDGLINLQVGLFAKLSLWSFSVINASFLAIDSTRSSMVNALLIDLASSLMSLICLTSAFRYVDLVPAVPSS